MTYNGVGADSMNSQEKITHLLRRFGFGASKSELDTYGKLGIDATIQRLIHYEEVDEEFPYSQTEFMVEKNGDLAFDAYRPGAWWALRMVLTQRPLQERLTLFWHDHFAVSASKVEFGPVMAQYLQSIRAHASGNFRNLIGAIARDPAMMLYLDNSLNTRIKPNENFARELLELFTMGSGYTEQDIKECARAFTGWLVAYAIAEGKGQPIEAQIRECVVQGRPLVSFALFPDMHDAGEKKILGETKSFDGGMVLDRLAAREETARNITTKLWEWFAYSSPESKVQERLIKAYFDGKYEIKKLLLAIVESDEFWSEKCVRSRVKSPVDFVVPIARQIDVRKFVLAMRPVKASPLTPPNDIAIGLGFGVLAAMQEQGLHLLFPPDVGGWEWGSNWISSAAMTERMRASELFFGDKEDQRLAPFLANRLMSEWNPKSAKELVAAILELFDAKLPRDKVHLLEEACEKLGGVVALRDPKSASALLNAVTKPLFGAPEFQFC